MSWIEILKQQVKDKGPRQVARELGVSHSTLSVVCAGKYNASTAKIEKRVSKIYGKDGKVDCPVLGVISPEKCADNWNKAKKLHRLVSNPDKLKLYYHCIKCPVRSV
jgi:hypothetical protein